MNNYPSSTPYWPDILWVTRKIEKDRFFSSFGNLFWLWLQTLHLSGVKYVVLGLKITVIPAENARILGHSPPSWSRLLADPVCHPWDLSAQLGPWLLRILPCCNVVNKKEAFLRSSSVMVLGRQEKTATVTDELQKIILKNADNYNSK